MLQIINRLAIVGGLFLSLAIVTSVFLVLDDHAGVGVEQEAHSSLARRSCRPWAGRSKTFESGPKDSA